MGKAKVRPGWQVYWPPGHLLKLREKQKLYDEGQVVEFEGDAPQIPALEVLPEEEERRTVATGVAAAEAKEKGLEGPPADKMARPGKRGSQTITRK